MKRRRIKTWVKVLVVVLLTISIYQLFTLKEENNTPAGTYNCRGGILKVCTGSNEVATYLGI